MAAVVAPYFSAEEFDHHHHHVQQHHEGYSHSIQQQPQQPYGLAYGSEDEYGNVLSASSPSSICSSESKPGSTDLELTQIEHACRLLTISADPYNWSEVDVRKWLMYQGRINQFPAALRLEELFLMDGMALCELTPENLHERIRRKLHRDDQDDEAWRCAMILFKNLNIWRTVCINFLHGPDFFDEPVVSHQPPDYYEHPQQTVHPATIQMQYQRQQNEPHYSSVADDSCSSRSSDIKTSAPPLPASGTGSIFNSPQPTAAVTHQQLTNQQQHPIVVFNHSHHHHHHHHQHHQFQNNNNSTTSDYGSDDDMSEADTGCGTAAAAAAAGFYGCYQDNTAAAAAYGASLNAAKYFVSNQQRPLKPPGQHRPHGSSSIQLWQFLKELLSVPGQHGQSIRWLDRERGVFKIEDSVRVARLWGDRKNRPMMNYDKLSRSIRQYYKKGIMKKTERAQRLVYQFCQPYSQ